jgi:hypothetical protein
MRTMSSLLNDFLNIYQTLSKFQRKVFKYLQWFSKKFRNVFPCIYTMTKALGCSDSTIKRATAFFHKMGWIAKCKRGYQSNIYYMNDELIRINLDDTNLFFREERPLNDPINDPVLSLLKQEKDISTGLEVQVCKTQSKQAPQKRDIPHFLNMKRLTLNDQQRLANEFSDFALVYAKKEAQKYVGWGNKIKSLIAIMWSLAKKC